MTPPPTSLTGQKRIISIDIMRGMVILLMIFVNDIASVHGAPAWMKHFAPHTGNGMTMADVVFPLFLFIVGLSMPFSLGQRLRGGESPIRVWIHIFGRTLALLIIGFFMVNSDEIGQNGILNPHLWTILMYLAIFMIWETIVNRKSNISQNKKSLLIKTSGLFLLVLLAFLYKSKADSGFMQMKPHWWGIIGLIGWAYLIACLIYIPWRNRPRILAGMMVILYGLYAASEAGYLAFLHLPAWIKISNMLATHPAIVLTGVILGTIISGSSTAKSDLARVKQAILYASGLAIGGWLIYSLHHLHPMFIINKNRATPTWGLYASAIGVMAWIILFLIYEKIGLRIGSIYFKNAGQNSLLAFMLAPLLDALIQWIYPLFTRSNPYDAMGSGYTSGLIRSLILALVLSWIAGRLKTRGFYLKV